MATMYCTNCGAMLDEDDLFCLNCGLPIEPQVAAATTAYPYTAPQPLPLPQGSPINVANTAPRSNKKTLIIVGSIAAALALIVVIVVLAVILLNPRATAGEQQADSPPARDVPVVPNTDGMTSDDEAPNPTAGDAGSDSKLALVPQSAPVEDVLPRASLSASSVYPHEIESDTGIGYDYFPEYILDGDFETAWIEGVEGSGINEWVQIALPEEATVSGFYIQNGFWRREDRLAQNNRITKLRVEFSDGTSEEFHLDDPVAGLWREQVSSGSAGLGERIVFSEPHETSYVRLVIVDVVRGSKWDDTAISGVQLFS